MQLTLPLCARLSDSLLVGEEESERNSVGKPFLDSVVNVALKSTGWRRWSCSAVVIIPICTRNLIKWAARIYKVPPASHLNDPTKVNNAISPDKPTLDCFMKKSSFRDFSPRFVTALSVLWSEEKLPPEARQGKRRKANGKIHLQSRKSDLCACWVSRGVSIIRCVIWMGAC